MSATFTGAVCRPMPDGQRPQAVMLRCPICLAQPERLNPTVLEYDARRDGQTHGRFWTTSPVRYVAVGVDQDAACLALLDHLDAMHAADEYLGRDFDATFTDAGIVTPRQWEKLLRRVKS